MRIPKRVRNVSISVAVLLIIFLSIGVLYTFRIDRGEAGNVEVAPHISEVSSVSPKPRLPSPNASEGVAVDVIDSPVKRGADTSVSVSTNAGSTCTILVAYNGVVAKSTGLAPTTADDYGLASWTWPVGNTVPIGTWPVKITCTYNGRSGVVDTSLQVTN
jgi:hypothetical protein